MNDIHSLSHNKMELQISYTFSRQNIEEKYSMGEKRAEIGGNFRELCRWKGVNLLSAEACPDHIHILVEIPPKMSVSGFMGFLKGKSSLMIYERWEI